jgi:hypothetical protein
MDFTPVFARRVLAAMLMGAAQQGEDAGAQLAARHSRRTPTQHQLRLKQNPFH